MSLRNRSMLEARVRTIHYAVSAIAVAVLTVAAVVTDGGTLAVVLGAVSSVLLVGSFLTVVRARGEGNEESEGRVPRDVQ